jgi:transcriptional regulator with XRE-family HTH domain
MRQWNQTALADKMGTTQNAISRLENPKTCKPTIKTLLKMADACDVALVVTFMPFSEYIRHLASVSEISVAIPSFGDDPGLMERETKSHSTISDPDEFYRPSAVIGPVGMDAVSGEPRLTPVLVFKGSSTPNRLSSTTSSEAA